MPRKNQRLSLRADPTRILRGGKAVPGDLVRACIADLHDKKKTQLNRRSAIELQMAKQFAQTRASETIDAKNPRTAQSLSALLHTHEKLAKQKLLAPKVAGGLGGLFPGRITVSVAPPFDYDVVIPTVLAGNQPTLEASSDKRTGKMSASAITATQKGFNGGSMYTTVGVYFHPLSAGRLTVSATPSYSFQWWTNSLRPNDLVRSFGSGGIAIYGVDVASQTTGGVGTIKSSAATLFKLWDENETAQVRFDFGFDIQAPASVSIDVSHELVYLLFVEADVHVEGVGWPGSLAGAKMSVTVPSITYDFEAQQVSQA